MTDNEENKVRSPSPNKKKLKLKAKNHNVSTNSKSNGSETKKKINRNICSICRDGGDLILCDKCPKSFHPKCLKIKQNDIPVGTWYCPTCM